MTKFSNKAQKLVKLTQKENEVGGEVCEDSVSGKNSPRGGCISASIMKPSINNLKFHKAKGKDNF
jgi:hypothetical protein